MSDERAAFLSWARSAKRDFAALPEIVGDARVVGLGESWHAVHEFLQLRFAIARILVEKLGFRTLLLEGSLAHADGFDRFVRGAAGWPVCSSLWNNAETEEFLSWLRHYNATSDQPVRIFGLDIGISMMEDIADPARILAGLGNNATARRILDSFRGLPPGEQHVLHYAKIPAADCQELLRFAQDAVARTTTGRDAHRARILLRGVEMYEAAAQSPTALHTVRDRALAENVRYFLADEAKAIIFGRNAHVAHQPWLLNGDRIPSIGTEINRCDYLVVATTFGRGEFDPPHPSGTGRIPDADPDGIDLAMDEVDASPYLLDIRTATGSWITAPRNVRSTPNFGWQQEYVLPSAFDVLLHVPAISSARPI